MLADVVAAFLDAVSEPELYPPFLELLRVRGYEKIHLLHGTFEFGKDSIAQRPLDGVLTQHAFQLKAGDLDLSAWHTAKGQIDQIRRNALGHPDFDAALPRRGVLVTTGVLRGAAAVDAQAYAEHLERTDTFRFELWDRQRLIAELLDAPSMGLAGGAQGPLLEILGRIDARTASDADLERFTRRWVGPVAALPRAALECAIVATRCRAAARSDQACLVALGLVRAAWASAHGGTPVPERATRAAALGRELFGAYAGELYATVAPDADGPAERAPG